MRINGRVVPACLNRESTPVFQLNILLGSTLVVALSLMALLSIRSADDYLFAGSFEFSVPAGMAQTMTFAPVGTGFGGSGDSQPGKSGLAVGEADSDEEWPAADSFIVVDTPAETIEEIPPVYPPMALKLGLEGKVWVKALVDTLGTVRKTIIAKTSGSTMLDDAALASAYKNRYKPGIQSGRPVPVWVTYPIDYVLDKSSQVTGGD